MSLLIIRKLIYIAIFACWFSSHVSSESQSTLFEYTDDDDYEFAEQELIVNQLVLASGWKPPPPKCDYGHDLGCFECPGLQQETLGRCYPESVENVNTTFYIYDRSKPESPRFQVKYPEVGNIDGIMRRNYRMDFDPAQDQLVFFTHGFKQSILKSDGVLLLKVSSWQELPEMRAVEVRGRD